MWALVVQFASRTSLTRPQDLQQLTRHTTVYQTHIGRCESQQILPGSPREILVNFPKNTFSFTQVSIPVLLNPQTISATTTTFPTRLMSNDATHHKSSLSHLQKPSSISQKTHLVSPRFQYPFFFIPSNHLYLYSNDRCSPPD